MPSFFPNVELSHYQDCSFLVFVLIFSKVAKQYFITLNSLKAGGGGGGGGGGAGGET